MDSSRYPQLYPKPRVRTTGTWPERHRRLATDPSMVHLVHSFWARFPSGSVPEQLRPEETAALIQPVLGADVAVGGLSAARLWGIPVPTGMAWADHALGEPVRVPWLDERPCFSFMGSRRHQGQRDIVMRKGQGLPTEVGLWGCQVTGALETLLAIQPLVPGWRSVAAVDSILATGLNYQDPRWPLSPTDLLDLVEDLPPRTRGARGLRQALSRAATDVWSPMETLLRLMVIESGAPPPTCNVGVDLPDGGRAYLDLAWKDEQVALEYNGAVHYQDRETYGNEMYRLNQLKQCGWDVHLVVGEDLRQRRRRLSMLRWLHTALESRRR